MSSKSIRDFEINDEELFYNLANLFYKSDAAHSEINQEFLRTTFLNCISQSPFIRGVFVICENEVCGYALLTFTYSNEYGGKVMEIDEIYIRDEFKRMGLANYFISAIIAEYEHDVVYVEVVMREDNEAAISLFDKFDFTPNEYLIMHKTL